VGGGGGEVEPLATLAKCSFAGSCPAFGSPCVERDDGDVQHGGVSSAYSGGVLAKEGALHFQLVLPAVEEREKQ